MQDDHERAQRIAVMLNELPEFTVDLATVQTNMVYANTSRPAAEVVEQYAANGVDMFDLSDNRIRVVVHLHITDEDVERFTDISQRLFG